MSIEPLLVDVLPKLQVSLKSWVQGLAHVGPELELIGRITMGGGDCRVDTKLYLGQRLLPGSGVMVRQVSEQVSLRGPYEALRHSIALGMIRQRRVMPYLQHFAQFLKGSFEFRSPI